MKHYLMFNFLLKENRPEAMKFLARTYGLDKFKSNVFCSYATELTSEELAYYFGVMDEAAGHTRVPDDEASA